MHQASSQVAQPAIAAAATTIARIGRAGGAGDARLDPSDLSPTRPEMALDLARTALVVIDPLAGLPGSRGEASSVPGGNATGQRTVRNIARLFRASEHAAITVAISLTSGRRHACFIPELKPYIEREAAIICAPHARYSPLPRVNDSGIALRGRRLRQIILAGFVADLRLESHLRDFLELGFEVAVVRDAIAGPELPEGEGYLSALINFRRVADALWTTEQVAAALGWARHGAKECAR